MLKRERKDSHFKNRILGHSLGSNITLLDPLLYMQNMANIFDTHKIILWQFPIRTVPLQSAREKWCRFESAPLVQLLAPRKLAIQEEDVLA